MSPAARVAVTTLVGLLLAPASPARATHPSRVELQIVPVAISPKGVVLFKYWRTLDPTGGYFGQRSEVGWLVVSGDGLWREVLHATVEEEGEKDLDRVNRFREEFKAEFDWKNPPKSVRQWLTELGFAKGGRVAPETGKGAVTWRPDKLCLGTRCTEVAIAHWAPTGLMDLGAKGRPIASSFYFSGVALFRCDQSESFGTDNQAGAVFRLPPNQYWTEQEGLVDIGYDLQCIDGISIVPKALREP